MKTQLQDQIQAALFSLQQQGIVPNDLSMPQSIQVEHTKDATHGDFATNIALVFAKKAGVSPRELAEKIIQALPANPSISKMEIAGPGFINFFVDTKAKYKVIDDILEQKENYGRSNIGHGKRVCVEYVSANPTGPLHVGHGRGAAYGSAIADLLEAIGYDVYREYYVNDAGRQMDILALSIWLRYLQSLNQPVYFPENGYQGDYILDIAENLKAAYQNRFYKEQHELFTSDIEAKAQDKETHIDALIERAKELLKDDFKLIHDVGMQAICEDIKEDLAEFGVTFQNFFSEYSLKEEGAIEKGIKALEKGGYVYEKGGALWFKSSKFGDEKDRVLVRANGQHTYFASDLAYHWNKLNRGFDILIDVFGADHHGYIPRIRAAMQALGLDSDAIKVPLVQFAILWRGGKRVQMSTRSGSFVTLRELREEIGSDAARFFYVMRKPEQHLDFDLDLAKSKTNENPVYYIQYAYARVCSVFRQLEEKKLTFDLEAGKNHIDLLVNPHEDELVKQLAKYPDSLAQAASNLEPHQLTNYLRELATAFHTYYNAHQFIVENEAVKNARLCLITAVKQVIQNGLDLLRIRTPESM